MTTAPFNPNGGTGGSSGYITSSTPDVLMQGPIAPGTKRKKVSAKFETRTEAQLIQQYGKMNPAARKDLAAKLKAAGFRVPVTGSYNQKVRDAFIDANGALSEEIKTLAANDISRLATTSYDLDSFLGNLAGSGAGAGGDSSYQQNTIINPSRAAKTLDSIAAELLGRQLSPEEKAKYTKMLQAEQKKPSSVTTTTVGTGASGMKSYTTTGGLDEEQFLIEKLAATDEAKAQKVLNAYQAVNKLFGGLQ